MCVCGFFYCTNNLKQPITVTVCLWLSIVVSAPQLHLVVSFIVHSMQILCLTTHAHLISFHVAIFSWQDPALNTTTFPPYIAKPSSFAPKFLQWWPWHSNIRQTKMVREILVIKPLYFSHMGCGMSSRGLECHNQAYRQQFESSWVSASQTCQSCSPREHPWSGQHLGNLLLVSDVPFGPSQ